MGTKNPRDYNCKDEELPIVSRFAAFSLRRDLDEFAAFSPKFNEEYATGYESQIAIVSDLVEPQSETTQRKLITNRLFATMAGLIDPINRVTGYIDLTADTLKVSATDFGLTQLRKGINAKDIENVIKSLHLVNASITKYKTELTAQGLSEELANKFVTAAVSIAADKEAQYEILTNRKAIVQNNVSVCNNLYSQLCEIMKVGKILYKATDPVKLQEYTFTDLKKRVHTVTTPTNATASKASTAGTSTTEGK